jgi:branched-subunit amino acid transport protein
LLERRPVFGRAASLIPAAVVTAVIVQLTITSRGDIVLDARLVGVGVAGLLVWRRASFLVVVVAAAAATAAVRALA